jgi:hypothetical protein
MYPFHWVPCEGRRHASLDEHPPGRSYLTGTEVTTLCGQELVAENSEFGWFWDTCPTCYQEALRLAGVPAR